jgi:primosomal protein N' (replication factor Y)
MIAKGHDFADVELGVVIDADAALAIPDFRAEERAFALVAQLAGRAGRSTQTAADARVLVQTWDPDQEFLAFARTHDIEGFLAAELERRRSLSYPPFTRLVRVLISAPNPQHARAWSKQVAESLRALDLGTVLGPAQLLRIAGREREQVLVKTAKVPAIAAAIRSALKASEPRRRREDVRIVLDVDPQSVV